MLEKICQSCGMEGYYISTDIRPCFPEEKVLLAIFWTNLFLKKRFETLTVDQDVIQNISWNKDFK